MVLYEANLQKNNNLRFQHWVLFSGNVGSSQFTTIAKAISYPFVRFWILRLWVPHPFLRVIYISNWATT